MLEAYNRRARQQEVQDVRHRCRARQDRRHDRDADPAPNRKRASRARARYAARRAFWCKSVGAIALGSKPMPQTRPDTADRPSHLPWPPILLVAASSSARSSSARSRRCNGPGSTIRPRTTSGWGSALAGVVLLVWRDPDAAPARHDRAARRRRDGAGDERPLPALPQPDLSRRRLILLGLAELTKNVWFVVAAVVFGRARHLARDPARGAPPRTPLRRGLSRLQSEVAPLDLEGAQWPPTTARRSAPSSTASRRTRAAISTRGWRRSRRGPAPPQRHHRLAAPAGLHVLQGLVAGAHPPQRRPADLRRRAARSAAARPARGATA